MPKRKSLSSVSLGGERKTVSGTELPTLGPSLAPATGVAQEEQLMKVQPPIPAPTYVSGGAFR